MSGVQSTGRNAQRRFHSDFGRQAGEMGRQRPPLRGLGDLPPEGLARRSQSALRVADERLVRADHPALRRRRQDVASARNAAGPGPARGRCPRAEQQVRLRHVFGNGKAAHDAPVVRRHAASMGIQARLAPRAFAEGPGHGLCGSRGRRAVPLPRRRQVVERARRACAGTARARNGSPAPAGCACTRSCSTRADPKRIFVAISAAGAFRTDDGGKTWKPINKGLHSQYIPDPDAEVGHCVHRIAMHRSRPNVLFMQKHWDVMRSDDAGESWHRGERKPADRLRVPDRHSRARARNGLRRSDQERRASISRPRESSASIGAVRAATSGSRSRRACRKRTATSTCCATRWPSTRSTRAAIYFGTTGGQVYVSRDAGENWAPIVRDLPAVLSVEVQTLP